MSNSSWFTHAHTFNEIFIGLFFVYRTQYYFTLRIFVTMVVVFGEKNQQGSDILSNLAADEHHQVISLLEETILATDLALYFK